MSAEPHYTDLFEDPRSATHRLQVEPSKDEPSAAFYIEEIKATVAQLTSSDPLTLRRAAAERGLTGLDLDANARLSDLEFGRLYEAVGRLDADLREIFGAGHGRMIDAYGTDELRRGWLPAIAAGALVGVAITEPTGGSDLNALRCNARRDGDDWLLNGSKGPMARIAEADAFVIFAVSDNGLTAFVVEADAAGLSRRFAALAGLGGWSFGELTLTDVRVRRAAVLGAPGQGRAIFNAHFANWRAFMALVAVGCGAAALETAREWAWSRELAHAPLAHVPAIVEKFGRHTLALDLARAVAHNALTAPSEARSDLAAAAKIAATDAAFHAVCFAIDVLGARGVMPATGLDKRLRDVTSFRIADGPNDVLAAHLGRTFLNHTA